MGFAKITANSRTATKLQFLYCIIVLSYILLYFFKNSEPITQQYLCYTHSTKEGLFQGDRQLAGAGSQGKNVPARASERQLGLKALSDSSTCSVVHGLWNRLLLLSDRGLQLYNHTDPECRDQSCYWPEIAVCLEVSVNYGEDQRVLMSLPAGPSQA